jgi:hypothetical protein
MSLFTPAAPKMDAPAVQAFSIPSCSEGVVIGDLLGFAKLPGNIFWYGNNRVEKVKEKQEEGGKGGGGSSKVVTGYKYYLSWAVGLVIGEVDELITVWSGEDVLWEGTLLKPVSGGVASITLVNLGTMYFYFGTTDQPRNAVMDASLTASGNTPSRNLCYAFFNDCLLGASNRVPQIELVIRKSPVYAWSDRERIGDYEYNPAHAIYHIIKEHTELPVALIDETNFAEVAETLYSEYRGIKCSMTEEKLATQWIEDILHHIDATFFYADNSKFKIKLFRGGETVGTLPSFAEVDFVDEPALNEDSYAEGINEVKVEFDAQVGESPDFNIYVLRGTFDENAIDTGSASNVYVQIHLSESAGRNSDDVSAIFDVIGDDYSKIEVYDHDYNRLYVEVTKWDSANKDAWFYILAPEVSKTQDKNFYIHYGETLAPDYTYIGGVGSSAGKTLWTGYNGVWHLGEIPDGVGSILDSTPNENHGTPVGTPTRVDGIGGYSLTFNGTTDFINCGSDPSIGLAGDAYQYEIIYHRDKLPRDWGAVVSRYDNGENYGFWAGKGNFYSTTNSGYMRHKSTGGDASFFCESWADDGDPYVQFGELLNGHIGTLICRRPGIITSAGSGTGLTAIGSYVQDLIIGAYDHATRNYFNSRIYEVRIKDGPTTQTQGHVLATWHSASDSLVYWTDLGVL